MKNKVFIIFTLLSLCFPVAAEKQTLRLGVLAFGTVNWELTALKHLNLLEQQEFDLKIQALANPQAGKIALQSGAVDIIVSDWIWVSRLRASGMDYTFYPYSTTAGAIMVAANSPIRSINDLIGKKLGIAGGELDKNWLLLQALAEQQKIPVLASQVEMVYAAPPLLNQQLKQKRVDAIINYWHFAARLEAEGYRKLMDGQDILNGLGIQQKMPTLGYVFNRSWANQNKTVINQFLLATQQAKHQLCHSDSVWQHIIPLTKAKDSKTQSLLRSRYCEGQINQWGENEIQAANQIYQHLRQVSRNKLTGHSAIIQTGTFWQID